MRGGAPLSTARQSAGAGHRASARPSFRGLRFPGLPPWRHEDVYMNRHALTVLEFHHVLESVAARAASDLGRSRVLELSPGTLLAPARAELLRVGETAGFLDRHRDWSIPEIPDARGGLKRLALEGSVLEAGELFSLGRLLASGRELLEGLEEASDELQTLDGIREGLFTDPPREKRIGQIVHRDGTVLDSASRELGRIRGRLRRMNGQVVKALEQLLSTLPDRIVVPDASVTIRDGRYVIPVRREGRGEVGGVVLDESATGATLFVEPPVALELMAELRELQREETREILRILREESDGLRPALPLLEASQEALVAFDSLYARARAALAWGGVAPSLLPAGTQEVEIVEGRHPLLLLKGQREVVPFDLRLEPGERVRGGLRPEYRRKERVPEGSRPHLDAGPERDHPAGGGRAPAFPSSPASLPISGMSNPS